MRSLSVVAWMIAGALLAGCGGNSNALTGKTTPGTTTKTATVAAIAAAASSPQVAGDGSTTVTITATATDSTGAVVAGATVAFTATAGSITATQATTTATGVATATLTAKGVATGTNITVTATSGSIKGTVAVAVVDLTQTITLTTSLPQIPSDGSKSATISAVVRNASNQFVSGIVVNFAATAGGGLTVAQGTTDATGTAIATLKAVSDPSNPVIASITVTATSGAYSALPLTVAVIGTKLNFTGAPSLVIGSTGSYTVTLVNYAGTGIANATVALASSAGNTLSIKSGVTNAQGTLPFTLTATKSGTDAITATVSDAIGPSLVGTEGITVGAQSLVFTTPVSGTTTAESWGLPPHTLTVALSNNGVAQPGQQITFAATRGILTPASGIVTTNASGQATIDISSIYAGPALVTATAMAGLLTSEVNLEFLATTAASVNLQASPATIAPLGQSTLTAVVRDSYDNLVAGQTVDFNVVDNTGGSLSVASAQTNSQGSAQTVYTASTTSSGTNDVIVNATVPAVETVAGAAISGSAKITVGGITLFLTLGTGNQISENAEKTLFSIPYTLEALDSAGNPVSGASITLTVEARDYYKGEYTLGKTAWNQNVSASCPNEDNTNSNPLSPLNFNGILDPGEDGCILNAADVFVDKDTGVPVVDPPNTCNAFGNGNDRLDPGGTAITDPGTVVSASDGSANFNVVYPEDEAGWVTVRLAATATVAGTSNTAVSEFTLPNLASYLTTLTSNPPGQISPYGTADVCTTAD